MYTQYSFIHSHTVYKLDFKFVFFINYKFIIKSFTIKTYKWVVAPVLVTNQSKITMTRITNIQHRENKWTKIKISKSMY